jgi:hypothetical protein
MATLEEALYGLNFSPAQTGYGIGQQALAQATPQLINPYGSTGQAIGISLGSVLLQSLLGYQARSQAAQDTLQANTLANQMMSMTTPQARTDFIGGLDASPDIGGRLSTLSTALTQQELASKAASAQQQAKFKQDVTLEAIKQGARPPEFANLFGKSVEEQLAPPPKEGIFGEYETTAQKRDRLIKQAKGLGLPPSERLDYATKNLKTEETQTKTALENINKIRQSVGNADAMISKATAGIAGAGETGGPALISSVRELASGMYQYAPTEGGLKEKQQRASQKELDSIRPEVVKELKSPGAVSNFETQMLIGAGPSSANTPTENARLLQNMIEINKLNNEYANFVETYVQDKGDASGADLLWNKYKKDQVLKNNQINPNRLPWETYFAQQKGEQLPPMPQVETDIEQRKAVLRQQIAQKEAEKQARLQQGR